MSKSSTIQKRIKENPNQSFSTDTKGNLYCQSCRISFKVADTTTVRRHVTECASHLANMKKWKDAGAKAGADVGRPHTLLGYTADAAEANRMAICSVRCDFSPHHAQCIEALLYNLRPDIEFARGTYLKKLVVNESKHQLEQLKIRFASEFVVIVLDVPSSARKDTSVHWFGTQNTCP